MDVIGASRARIVNFALDVPRVSRARIINFALVLEPRTKVRGSWACIFRGNASPGAKNTGSIGLHFLGSRLLGLHFPRKCNPMSEKPGKLGSWACIFRVLGSWACIFLGNASPGA